MNICEKCKFSYETEKKYGIVIACKGGDNFSYKTNKYEPKIKCKAFKGIEGSVIKGIKE